MSDNKNKLLTTILIVIIIAIIVVVGIVIYNVTSNKTKTTEEEASKEETTTTISGNSKKSTTTNVDIESIDISTSSSGKQKLENYNIIGRISIPKIGLNCEILEEVTKRSIEIAVGQMYTTGGLNQPGTTVIYGHNYRNTLFFSRNDELEIGDIITITDTEGHKENYEIYNKFVTTSTDTSFYTRTAEITGGIKEVVLSTCTDDVDVTDNRLIIQAREQ